jgi:response regulator RpfG family c-di-GMP phosphodiesterase
MPQMDGLELLRQVRARHPDVAVVLITAVADVEVAVSCLAIGAMDYLTKPFHLEEVRARVTQALEKRRLILENRDYQERLEERVAAQARRLEELFLTSVQSLAEALELKDPYTRGHSVRVSHYSVAIARALRLDDDTVRQVEIGGHVHDIGKIGVRESVLNKEGPLTTEEYEHIMTHPVLGWRILSPLLRENPVALNIVRSHHERFDGRGTPDGLAGAAIPLEARIAAVDQSGCKLRVNAESSGDDKLFGLFFTQAGYDAWQPSESGSLEKNVTSVSQGNPLHVEDDLERGQSYVLTLQNEGESDITVSRHVATVCPRA